MAEAALARREDREVDPAEVKAGHFVRGQQRVDAPPVRAGEYQVRVELRRGAQGTEGVELVAAGVEVPVRGQVDQATLRHGFSKRFLVRACARQEVDDLP